MAIRDEHRNYALVGLFVLAMATGLVVWLALLAGRTGATDRYHVHYENVLGLGEGTQVYFEGFPVGVIDEIAPVEHEGRQRFRVDISVRRGWRIPADSRAAITASGLLSAFLIDIQGGESPESLPPGSEISGVEMANVFAIVSSVADELTRLTDETLEPLLGSLGESTPAVLENLEATSRDLMEAMASVNALLGEPNTGRVAAILANVEDTSGSLASIARDLVRTREQVDEVVATLREMVENSDGEVTHAVADVHHTLESLAAHIDAINHNLETTTRNMSEFSDHIRRNPGLLLRGREDGEVDVEASR